MLEGLDWLFGAEYPKVVEKNHPKGWAAGFFYGLYRDRQGNIAQRKSCIPIATKLLVGRRAPIIRVQVLWDDRHSYSIADLHLDCVANALKELEEFGKLCIKKKVQLEISPFCEHSLPPATMEKVLNRVAALCPSARVVSSVWNTGVVKGQKNEVHGDSSSAAYKGVRINYSLDGVDTFNSNYEKARKVHRGKNVDAFFHWIPQFNRKRVIDEKTPREDRTVRPTVKQVRHLILMSQITNFKGVKLPSGWTYKPQAEQHSPTIPQGRDCKPLVLSPNRVQEMSFRKGKRSVKLYYTGTLDDGTHVMRGPEWATDAMNKLGAGPNDLVEIVADGKVIGRVNLLLRAGSFR